MAVTSKLYELFFNDLPAIDGPRAFASVALVDEDALFPLGPNAYVYGLRPTPFSRGEWARLADIPAPRSERRWAVALAHDEAGELLMWSVCHRPHEPGRSYDIDWSRSFD